MLRQAVTSSVLLLPCACTLLLPSTSSEKAGPVVELDAEVSERSFLVRICYDGELADSMSVTATFHALASRNEVDISMGVLGDGFVSMTDELTLDEDYADDPERMYAWMCLDGFEVHLKLLHPDEPAASVRWSIQAQAHQVSGCGAEEIFRDEIVIEIEEL